MTIGQAKAIVLRMAREINDDLDEPGYLLQATVDRLASELVTETSAHEKGEEGSH